MESRISFFSASLCSSLFFSPIFSYASSMMRAIASIVFSSDSLISWWFFTKPTPNTPCSLPCSFIGEHIRVLHAGSLSTSAYSDAGMSGIFTRPPFSNTGCQMRNCMRNLSSSMQARLFIPSASHWQWNTMPPSS